LLGAETRVDVLGDVVSIDLVGRRVPEEQARPRDGPGRARALYHLLLLLTSILEHVVPAEEINGDVLQAELELRRAFVQRRFGCLTVGRRPRKRPGHSSMQRRRPRFTDQGEDRHYRGGSAPRGHDQPAITSASCSKAGSGAAGASK